MLLSRFSFSVMGSAVHVQRKIDTKKSSVNFSYLTKRSPVKCKKKLKKIVSLLQSFRKRKLGPLLITD